MIKSQHQVQHTPSTEYSEYSTHQVQHTPCTAYTEYSIHRVQHTPSTAYTEYSIHRVQHTPSTAYTEYNIHRVTHTLSTTYTAYCIIPRSTVSRSQPVSHLWADHVVLNSLHSHNYELTNEYYSVSSRHTSLPPKLPPPDWPPASTPPISLNHGSKCISKLARLQPPSVSRNLHDYCLQVRTIMASKCISLLARSRLPSASPDSLNHSLQVYL